MEALKPRQCVSDQQASRGAGLAGNKDERTRQTRARASLSRHSSAPKSCARRVGPNCAASHVFRVQAAIGRVSALSHALCFVGSPKSNPLLGACCLSWPLSDIHQEHAWPKTPTPLTVFVRRKIVAKEPSLQHPRHGRAGNYWYFLLTQPQPYGSPSCSTPTFFIACQLLCPNV